MTLKTAGQFLIRFGTLVVLAYLAWQLIELEFRLGVRGGIRAAVALAAPLLAGGYAFANHRRALERIGSLPAAVRFAAAFAVGALAMASIRFFPSLYPLPIAELVVASCIAALVFGSGSRAWLARPLTAAGIAVGMLAYVARYGIPRIVG